MRTLLVTLLLTASACSQTRPPAADTAVAPPLPAAGSAQAPGAVSPPKAVTTTPAEPTPREPAGDAPLVTLARSACYGFCPVYSVTVRANGAVEYQGERFVKVSGKAAAQLPEADLARLKQAFVTAKFSALRDSYETVSRTDAPSAVVSFADGAHVKTVRHYHGDSAAPPELSKLEDEIDTIVHVEQWIGTQAERAKDAGKWGR